MRRAEKNQIYTAQVGLILPLCEKTDTGDYNMALGCSCSSFSHLLYVSHDEKQIPRYLLNVSNVTGDVLHYLASQQAVPSYGTALYSTCKLPTATLLKTASCIYLLFLPEGKSKREFSDSKCFMPSW